MVFAGRFGGCIRCATDSAGCGKGWCLCPRPLHAQEDDDIQVRAQKEEVDGSSSTPKGDGTKSLPDVSYADGRHAFREGSRFWALLELLIA